MHLVSARLGSAHFVRRTIKPRKKSPVNWLIFYWRRGPGAGSTRWHVTAPPLRFSAGGSRGRKPDSRQSPKPTFGRSGTMPPLTRRLTIKNRLRSIKSFDV